MLKAMVIAVLMMASAGAWGQTQEPAGCLEATRHSNGPCKLTYPNGAVIETRADGRTWMTLPTPDKFRFEVGKGEIASVTGQFRKNIVMNLPMEADIIQAPQSEMMEIMGDCQSKTFQVYGTMVTDVNGVYDGDTNSSPENFARRVMPGSPMEIVFKTICAN